jgi:hypothetical protein
MADKYASQEEREAAEFASLGITPPKVIPHGSDKDISEYLKPEMPTTWRQEGNQLIGESEKGRFVQTIPTSHILTGTDEKGLPTFKKIVL